MPSEASKLRWPNQGGDMNKGISLGARRAGLAALAMFTMIAAGCGGGSDAKSSSGSASSGAGAASASNDASSSGTSSSAPSSGQSGTSNTAPRISAQPIGKVDVGARYVLKPTAQDADGDTLAFSIQNKPRWASFSTASGELSGTPSAQDVGAYANVMISVSDGKSTAALPAFAITVAANAAEEPQPVPVDGADVALSWSVPTLTEDGEALSDLAGYRVHYGARADAMTETIELSSAGLNHYVVQNLEKGTYYFAVRAITKTGMQSKPSNVISRIIG